MTVKKFEYVDDPIEKAKKRLGKPYKQQAGRKAGKGAGKIVEHPTPRGAGSYHKLIGDVTLFIKNNPEALESTADEIGKEYYAESKDDGGWQDAMEMNGHLPTEYDCQQAAQEALDNIESYHGTEPDDLEKARIGKPYAQQVGRKVGEGRGKIHPAEARWNAQMDKEKKTQKVLDEGLKGWIDDYNEIKKNKNEWNAELMEKVKEGILEVVAKYDLDKPMIYRLMGEKGAKDYFGRDVE